MIIEHPHPIDSFHALLIPRQAISGLDAIQPGQARILLEILQTAGMMAKAYGLQNYKIVVNSGDYQEIPQLHFHMISSDKSEGHDEICG